MAQMGIRGAFLVVGPLVGHGIDAWGVPSVLWAPGILYSIVSAILLLPLMRRDIAPSQEPEPKLP
jgi:hypothetical protein